ncbi:sugar porter family MFS transporter [Massilia sp. RP-1-19]|uniref:Sugar porter family MFS transporter n=1 Tax=Massilia polaris TaxID=2728846 RepID=A0A848HKN5_9BURK|nr:MFS transporter [Massilia polaris]NML59813.1 sugar porter family MFS transporter [Massilia polaris]
MSIDGKQRLHLLFLTAVCGLGGLLYGIDIGIIDPALPYLHRATSLTEGQLSLVVAAVMGGSILGSVVAGMLADWLGRRPMMVVSALLFVGSVTVIYLSQSFVALLLGRLLQGLSGGVIAVVVPLYLAECLPASQRGRGLALFQLALTAGIVLAAFIGNHYLSNAELAIQAAGGDVAAATAAADRAWRSMFLAVLYPGTLFLLGCLFVTESPRWLMRRGRAAQAESVLARLRPAAQCEAEVAEIGAALAEERARPKLGRGAALAEMLTERRYVLPFVLACVILGCNQATGINSLLQFMSTILQHAGLDPVSAASYGTAIKILNSLMTVAAIMLVERKGRVFLLKIGTAGIMVSLCLLALLFHRFESQRVDVRAEVAALVRDNALDLSLADARFARSAAGPVQLTILYQYGARQQVAEAYTATPEAQAVLARAQALVRTLPQDQRALLDQARAAWSGRADPAVADSAQQLIASLAPDARATIDAARRVHTAQRIAIRPAEGAGAGGAALEIVRASVGPIPDRNSGMLAALCIAGFIAAFSIGPGVCVWLALSELMPTRIRSVGMGVALLINQGTGTLIAGAFLPIVGNFGYHMMFLFWAACTAVYFITATFFLPETKGQSLEEIERLFARSGAAK